MKFGSLTDLKIKQGDACLACGRQPPAVKLTVDHIKPKAAGGTNEQENLQILCEACNVSKRDKEIDFRGRPQRQDPCEPGQNPFSFRSFDDVKAFFRDRCANLDCPNRDVDPLSLVEDYVTPRSKARRADYWSNVQPLCPDCAAAKAKTGNNTDFRPKYRQELVCEPTGRYGLSIVASLENGVFQGADCTNTLDALKKQGRISHQHNNKPNKIVEYSYYQLTRAEAVTRYGKDTSRHKPIRGAKALNDRLAVLCFCSMGEPRRELLERHHLERFIPADELSALRTTRHHCIEGAYQHEDKSVRPTRIYQMFIADKAPEKIAHDLLDAYQRYRELPTIHQWMSRPNRLYAFAVLLPTAHKVRDLARYLDRETKLEDGRPIKAAVHIHVESVPTPETLSQFLRQRRV